MRFGLGLVTAYCVFLPALPGQAVVGEETATVTLSVPSGAPLRLYLTQKVSKRLGEPVYGKIMEPVFAFDREIVPIGSEIIGKVTRLTSAGKARRFQAVMNGDFTPLHDAQLEFESLKLPDGRILPLQTMKTAWLNSIYKGPSKHKKVPNGGVLGAAKQTVKDRINSQINARSMGIADIVRGPNKKEKMIDLLWAKLPYHPQYLRRGSRFDAPLRDALGFGTTTVALKTLTEMGSQPSADSVVRARLLTAVDSSSAKQGQIVEAVVVEPLFSADHKLVLPEGARLSGAVTVAKKARSFHRPGKLRFNFQKMELPAELASLRPTVQLVSLKTQATLDGAEGSGPAKIKVDSEGGVQAQESKTRFIAPLIAIMLAGRAADHDADRHDAGQAAGARSNIGGRTLGGGSGFGLLGMAASQSSRYVGMAFGYYGMAWSVYLHVIAKGGEVTLDRNAMMDIRFGARPAATGSKLRALVAGSDGLVR